MSTAPAPMSSRSYTGTAVAAAWRSSCTGRVRDAAAARVSCRGGRRCDRVGDLVAACSSSVALPMARRVISSTGTPIAIAPSPKRRAYSALNRASRPSICGRPSPALVDGHRQLRSLTVEAQVGFEPHAALRGGHAVALEVGEHAGAQRGERRAHELLADGQLGGERLHALAVQRGRRRAVGGEHRREVGEHRAAGTDVVRDVAREQATAPAVGHERQLRRDQAAGGDAVAHRPHHGGERDLADAPRGLDRVEPGEAADGRARLARAVGVERHATVEEPLGIDVAEHHERVGERGLRAAPAVARGPRVGARRLRADPDRAHRSRPTRASRRRSRRSRRRPSTARPSARAASRGCGAAPGRRR